MTEETTMAHDAIEVGEVAFWSLEIVFSIVLAWGFTRFWKHRPELVWNGSLLEFLSRWRAHALYCIGWLSYVVYMFVVRPQPMSISGWRVVSVALIVAGLILHRENSITE